MYYINKNKVKKADSLKLEVNSIVDIPRVVTDVEGNEFTIYEKQIAVAEKEYIETITNLWTEEPPPVITKRQRLDLVQGESGVEWSIIDLSDTEVQTKLQQEYAQIDAETQANIFDGFDHDNYTFSLSLSAQSNWAYLLTRYSVGPFPEEGVEISTKDGGAYTLTKEKAPDFFQAAATHKENALAEGRRRKAEVRAWYE